MNNNYQYYIGIIVLLYVILTKILVNSGAARSLRGPGAREQARGPRAGVCRRAGIETVSAAVSSLWSLGGRARTPRPVADGANRKGQVRDGEGQPGMNLVITLVKGWHDHKFGV